MRDYNREYEELQRRFFSQRKAGDKDAQKTLSQMHMLMAEYQRRRIGKYCKKNGVAKPDDEIGEDAEDMAAWVTAMYLTRPNWGGVERMTAYCHNAFMKVLFDPKRVERERAEREIRASSPAAHCGEIGDEPDAETALSEPVADGVRQGILPFDELTEGI